MKQTKQGNKTRGIRSSVSMADLSHREFLRPVEAQRLFGIGQGKFNLWVEDSAFPTFRPDADPKSRTVLVRKADVAQYIETGVPVIRPVQ